MKTPSSSLKTLKHVDASDSSSSTPVYSRKTTASLRCTTPEESSDTQASQSFLKHSGRNIRLNPKLENESGLESSDTKEDIRKFCQNRRQSLSTFSIKSESTLTNVRNFFKKTTHNVFLKFF